MDGCGERATDGILERNVKGLGVGWEHIPTVTACSKNMWVLHEVFAWTGKDHAVMVKPPYLSFGCTVWSLLFSIKDIKYSHA